MGLMAQSGEAKQLELGDFALDPASLSKKRAQSEGFHLNLRLTGEDARIYKYLEQHTGPITDSLRVRDSLRVIAYLVALNQRGAGLTVTDEAGQKVDLLDYIGAFQPQGPMDIKRQTRSVSNPEEKPGRFGDFPESA